MPSLGFDTSSYPSAQVAPQDSLAMIGKVLQIQGAQQAIQNQQMEFKARQALGPILQQSIDPTSGELDINKFLVHGASNPDVAWKMPEITLQMIQRQNTQADTVNKQLTSNTVRYKAMGDAAGSLVAQAEQDAAGKVNLATGGTGTPGLTSKQIASTLSTLVGENGLIDAKDAAEILTKTAGMNDAQRFQFAKNFANSARGVEKTMGEIYGAINPVNTGGGTAFVQQRPLIGQTRQVGGVETTPTPAEMNSPVAGVDAQGRPTMRPRVQAAPMYGGSGAPIAGSGQASAPTGLSPQEAKLQEGRAANIAGYEDELAKLDTAAQGTLRSLDEMDQLVKKVKVGGGAEVRAQLASAAAAFGASDKIVNAIGNGDLGASQALQKFFVINATDNMKQQFANAQRYTNLDFSTYLKNSGTLATSPYGLQKIMQFMRHGSELIHNNAEHYQDIKQNGFSPSAFGGKYKNADLSSYPTYWNEMLSTARQNANKRGQQ